MYAPYPENMMESIKKVEATRAERMATEPRRLTADEKDALLKEFHPDYNPDAFAQIKVGANKGQKTDKRFCHIINVLAGLHGNQFVLPDCLVQITGGAKHPGICWSRWEPGTCTWPLRTPP